MHRTRKLFRLAAVSAVAVAMLAPATAHAKKKGPLEGEPVVRQKLELRKLRFQLTPMVAMSISQPFVHVGYAGAKAQFDFTDWIGARATFGYGVVTLDSQLTKDLRGGGLPVGRQPGEPDPITGATCQGVAPCRNESDAANPAPLLHDFEAGLTQATWQSSVDAVFTPFSGKLGLFSAIFTEYDLYIFGGLGLIGAQKRFDQESTTELNQIANAGDPGADGYCFDAQLNNEPNQECLLHPVSADTGVKVGGSFGAGLHVFITDWVAINMEIQDILIRNNLTGLNATIESPPRVDNDDKDLFHNVTLQLGATFYFPFKAKRTR
jgi:outer membrane beta-barrel protein